MSFTNRRPPQHVSFRETPSNEGAGNMMFDGMDYSGCHVPAAQDGIHIPRFVSQPIQPEMVKPMERHEFHRDAAWDRDAPNIPRFGSDLGPKKSPFNDVPVVNRELSNEVVPQLPVFKLA